MTHDIGELQVDELDFLPPHSVRISPLLGLSPRICLCSFELPIASATAATIDWTFLPPRRSPPAARTGILAGRLHPPAIRTSLGMALWPVIVQREPLSTVD